MSIDGFEPVKIDTSTVKEIEYATLFWIDDVEYKIPKEIPANYVVRYLRDVNDAGPEIALARVTEEVLGVEAMDALADCPAVDDEQMAAIFDIIEKLLMAKAKTSLGKSNRAQRRSRGSRTY